MSYGNHTKSHFLLSSISKKNQEEEINDCHEFLNNGSIPDRISRIFSVPFGGINSFNNDTVKILLNLNYKGILLSRSRVNNIFSSGSEDSIGIKTMERFMPLNDLKLFKKQVLSLSIRSLLNLNL